MCVVDLTRIAGIDVTTALAVVSETVADMSRFPTVGHFVSWLGLCPGRGRTTSRSGIANVACLTSPSAPTKWHEARRRWTTCLKTPLQINHLRGVSGETSLAPTSK